MPYPRKNGKSTLCIKDDIMKLEEYIENHKDLAKEIGYNGCKNCKYQIEPLRMCEAAEKGAFGDRVYLICPGWEKKEG